jgi:hypothetical protein
MRLWSLAIVVALLSVCCSDKRSVRFDNPTTPTNPGNQATPLTGTWVGAALDSTGGMMGSGQGQATITLQLNQNGTQVTGTMDASGFTTPAGQAGPTIVGTVSGQTFTFTMNDANINNHSTHLNEIRSYEPCFSHRCYNNISARHNLGKIPGS